MDGVFRSFWQMTIITRKNKTKIPKSFIYTQTDAKTRFAPCRPLYFDLEDSSITVVTLNVKLINLQKA